MSQRICETLSLGRERSVERHVPFHVKDPDFDFGDLRRLLAKAQDVFDLCSGISCSASCDLDISLPKWGDKFVTLNYSQPVKEVWASHL